MTRFQIKADALENGYCRQQNEWPKKVLCTCFESYDLRDQQKWLFRGL